MDCFSCFRETGFERLSNSPPETEDQHRRCTFPDKQLMMLGSPWKKGKHVPLPLPEENKPKEQDVEDWIMAFSLLNNNNGGGVTVKGFNFKLASNKVFPYLKAENRDEDVGKEGMEMEMEMEVGLQKSQSWKPNKKKDKRVTFRFPEEADIFIFDSTPEEDEEGEEGMLYVF